MKKIITKTVFIIVLNWLFCVSTYANTATYPTMQDGVTDTIGLLTQTEYQQINHKIIELENETGAQLAVLIISSTRNLSIEQYANEIFNKWRLDREGIDDGVLLLVALNDRTVRIEVGYGLEGQITDLFSNKVISDYIIPYFKQGMYSKGIDSAVDTLIAQIKQESLPEVNKSAFFINKPSGSITWIDFLAGYLVGAGLLLWILGLYRLIKARPLKGGIPIACIIALTWYFGGFDITTWNGLTFGEEFLRTDLPRWVQILFLQIFPAWFSIVMILTCFAVAAITFLGILAVIILTLSKRIKSKKIKGALSISIVFGFIIFMIVYNVTGILWLALVITFSNVVGLSWGILTGKVKLADGGGRSTSRANSGRSNDSYRSSSHSSGSSRSGGGGHSGGGSSGRW